MSQPEEEPLGIFHDIVFTIILTPDLPNEDIQELIDILKEGGAQYEPLDSHNRIKDIKQLTHVISATSDFADYQLALEAFIHVVKPSYVQQCIEKGKQMNPRQYSPDHNLILSDVVIACANIPEGDKEAIAGGVLAMGGIYSAQLTKLVTHLIALSDEDERCKLAKEKRLKCKILIPHWFDDCLRLGRRIKEDPYEFPDPEIILSRTGKPPPPRVSEEVKGASSPHPKQLPTPDPSFSNTTRRLTVFKDRKIILSEDLDIREPLRRTLTELISTGGGHVVELLTECDTLVCQYREGEEYIQACQNLREVGNLGWLYHMITHNRWTSPTRRLLHYPVPKNGIPGFENFVISVSNYAGEARLYLENLVKACGAQFTKTMRQDNTHLITAHTASEKCDAAKEWNINVVNHLWLEESYANHREQALTIKKYTHFPPRTNLGEVVGQTRIDRQVVEKYFYPKVTKKNKRTSKITSDAPTLPTDSSNAESLETVDTASQPEPLQEVDNMDVDEEPPTTVQKAKRGRTAPTAKATPEEDEAEAPTTAKAKRSRTDPGIKTPALRKFMDSEKENDTPGTTGSRGAKARAMSRLHDAAADIALYDKERKRVGGVTHGRDRRESTMDPDTPAGKEKRGRKRQSTEMEEDAEQQDDEEAAPAAGKRGKRVKSGEKLPAISYRMVLTGYQRWVDEPKFETAERNVLRNLGISIVEDTSKVDILCAPKIVRTKKFICALAHAPYVVSTSFLDYCIKNRKVPDPEKYSLQDRETEERLGIKLRDSIEQAERHEGQLLQGWQIFCTQDVNGGFDIYKAIIEANGGVAMLYKGRTAMNVSKRSFDAGPGNAGTTESQGDDSGNMLYLISGDKKSEIGLWDKFKQMAEAADMVPVVTRADWLLSVAMRHSIHWDDKWQLGV